MRVGLTRQVGSIIDTPSYNELAQRMVACGKVGFFLLYIIV
jgi:hypothetical protein